MKNEFYNMIIKQLELLMSQNDLNTEVFIFKDNNKFVGFEFNKKNKSVTSRLSEKIEAKSIIDLYLESKKKLGFQENQIMFKALRLSNNLTLQEVANMLNKTRQEVFRWENTYNPPNEIITTLKAHIDKKNKLN